MSNLFVDKLQEAYYTAKHLADILGKMHAKSTNYELKNAFTNYRELTKSHIPSIEKVFHFLGKEPESCKCEEIREIIKEADDIIRQTAEGSYKRDTALIKVAQKAGQYGMAVYGALADMASETGFGKAATLLKQILDEEREAETLFTNMAEKLMYSYVMQAVD